MRWDLPFAWANWLPDFRPSLRLLAPRGHAFAGLPALPLQTSRQPTVWHRAHSLLPLVDLLSVLGDSPLPFFFGWFPPLFERSLLLSTSHVTNWGMRVLCPHKHLRSYATSHVYLGKTHPRFLASSPQEAVPFSLRFHKHYLRQRVHSNSVRSNWYLLVRTVGRVMLPVLDCWS